MREILVFTLLSFCSTIYAQNEWKSKKGFSFYLGYSTAKAAQGGIGYVRNGNNYSLGYSSQRGGQNGKEVSKRLENYGNTITGSGTYFEGVDGTYERFLSRNLAIGAIATVGTEKHFANYRDERFTDDGYHYINSKKTSLGLGGQAAYYLKDLIGISIGYHSVYKARKS
ncbi:hypothetical protein ABDK00_013285 [Niabella insulamsoli]|uniref:hypothetical protein n=1 Tax=Niabella insulamsoli TaxID=3144874 RepID=UPI0031FCCCF5